VPSRVLATKERDMLLALVTGFWMLLAVLTKIAQCRKLRFGRMGKAGYGPSSASKVRRK